eukprot:1107382-Rhodomonas_salina.1
MSLWGGAKCALWKMGKYWITAPTAGRLDPGSVSVNATRHQAGQEEPGLSSRFLSHELIEAQTCDSEHSVRTDHDPD